MKKNKQGRPKGSKSTTPVRLKDLNKHLAPNSIVFVGTTWLENIGFNINESELVTIDKVTITPDNTPIEVRELDLT